VWVSKPGTELNSLSKKIIHWFGMNEISHFFPIDHSDNNVFITFLWCDFLFCSFSASDGNAKLNKDFTFASSDDLVFKPGEVYLSIDVPILSDDFTEDDENFTISMASKDDGVTTVTQGTVTITIANNSEFSLFAFFNRIGFN